MGTHLHDRENKETEIASDLRIGNRKFRWAKQRSCGQEVFALRSRQTGRNTRGGPEKGRVRRDVCHIAQKIPNDCVLHSAESRRRGRRGATGVSLGV